MEEKAGGGGRDRTLPHSGRDRSATLLRAAPCLDGENLDLSPPSWPATLRSPSDLIRKGLLPRVAPPAGLLLHCEIRAERSPRRRELRHRVGAGVVARITGDRADEMPRSILLPDFWPAGAPVPSCSWPAAAFLPKSSGPPID